MCATAGPSGQRIMQLLLLSGWREGCKHGLLPGQQVVRQVGTVAAWSVHRHGCDHGNVAMRSGPRGLNPKRFGLMAAAFIEVYRRGSAARPRVAAASACTQAINRIE